MDVVNMQSLKLSHVTETLEYDNENILKMWTMENITEVPEKIKVLFEN